MTTLTEAREALYKTLTDGWTTTPIVFGNEKYTPSSSITTAFHVRAIANHTDSQQDSLGSVGNRRFLRQGMFFIQILGPLNKGLKTLDEYATTIRDLYEGKTRLAGTNIRIYGVVIEEGPIDGLYSSLVVNVPFEYEEIK